LKASPRHVFLHIAFIHGLVDLLGALAKDAPECRSGADSVGDGRAAGDCRSEACDAFSVEAVCVKVGVAEAGECVWSQLAAACACQE